ncbi:hypothetical protein FISHEDRAFT_53299 [Fistulina hepatica ATCC 64428]|nr:hypothetical protein FISHEDRAFT_53299 [Fistulina hepatica ATCC 64428]
MKFSLTFIFALVAVFCITMTRAVPVAVRDVFVPPVEYPTNGTIWYSFQTQNVTWDTSNAPAQITNPVGRIMLRKDGLTTPLILANGFDILQGWAEVTVPYVLNGDDYEVVLFGDSGNFGGPFTIISGVDD